MIKSFVYVTAGVFAVAMPLFAQQTKPSKPLVQQRMERKMESLDNVVDNEQKILQLAEKVGYDTTLVKFYFEKLESLKNTLKTFSQSSKLSKDQRKQLQLLNKEMRETSQALRKEMMEIKSHLKKKK